MKDFKQTTKMSAQGKHYCGGGKVKKYADGGDVTSGSNANIGDDVRARAMAAMAQRDQDIGGGGQTGSTPAPKKAAPAKLAPPDYSNEDLDKIDADNAAYERKRESTALLNRKPAPKFSPEAAAGARPGVKVPSYAKAATGYKKGGKVKRGAKK